MPRIYFKRGRWRVDPIRQFLCFGVPENHRKNDLAEQFAHSLNHRAYLAKTAKQHQPA